MTSAPDAIAAIRARLAQLQRPDLGPLAAEIRQILIDDNRRGLLDGIDADDRPMMPLSESTRRSRARYGGDDTPGGGSSSSLIQDFDAIVELSPTGFRIEAGWRGDTARKAALFSSGTFKQAARPIMGIRPSSWAKIRAAVDRYLGGVAQSRTP